MKAASGSLTIACRMNGGSAEGWKPELVHRCGRRAMYLYLYCFSPQAVASAVDVLCGLYVLQSRAVAHRPAGDGLSGNFLVPVACNP